MPPQVSVPPSRVSIVEIRGGSFVVADLRAIDGGSAEGGGGDGAAADALAYRVADALLVDGSALYSGQLTQHVDPRQGVLRIDALGRCACPAGDA